MPTSADVLCSPDEHLVNEFVVPRGAPHQAEEVGGSLFPLVRRRIIGWWNGRQSLYQALCLAQQALQFGFGGEVSTAEAIKSGRVKPFLFVHTPTLPRRCGSWN